MTKKRRTLFYTPLGIRPIIHHGPPDPDANLLSLDFSPSAAANVDAVVTAAPTTAARKRRRGYARTVSQKKEARRERRGATSATGGDVHRRRHRRDDEEDDELDEAEENSGRCDEKRRASSSAGHTDEVVIGFRVDADEDECDSDDDDDAEDIGEAIDADAVDTRFFDRGVDADTATNDNDFSDEYAGAMDHGDAVEDDESDDAESSALGRRTTRAAFRSSSTSEKKRRVIRDDDESSTGEEDERPDTNKEDTSGREYVVPARITTKTITKSTLSNRGSLSDDGEMKEEQRDDCGDNSRTRRGRRLGRAPVTKRADTDHSSTEKDDESEFMVDSTASTRKRNVSKRGGRSKLTKINVAEHGRCFYIVLRLTDILNRKFVVARISSLTRLFVIDSSSLFQKPNIRGRSHQHRRLVLHRI